MKSQWCQFDSQIKWNRFEIWVCNFVFPRHLLNLDLQKRFMTLLVNDLECAMFSWIIAIHCRCETQRKKQLFFFLSDEEVMRARFTSTAKNSHQWNLSGLYLWSIECLSYTFHTNHSRATWYPSTFFELFQDPFGLSSSRIVRTMLSEWSMWPMEKRSWQFDVKEENSRSDQSAIF